MSISNINNVVSVLQVKDQEKSVKWYHKLFSRKPDIRPKKNIAEWHLAKNSWLQITVDDTDIERIGKGTVMIEVNSLQEQMMICDKVNISYDKQVQYLEFIKMFQVSDPDGNKIYFIEDISNRL